MKNFNFFQVALAAVVGALVLYVIKQMQQITGLLPSDLDTQDAEKRQKELEKDIQVHYEYLPQTPAYYKSAADRIEKACQNAGTDSNVIKDIFTDIRAEEAVAIYKEFGIRKNMWMVLGSYTGDLFVWLDQELGFFDSGLKKMLKEIYAQTELQWK